MATTLRLSGAALRPALSSAHTPGRTLAFNALRHYSSGKSKVGLCSVPLYISGLTFS